MPPLGLHLGECTPMVIDGGIDQGPQQGAQIELGVFTVETVVYARSLWTIPTGVSSVPS